jgi:glycosyltransferase involved in cell wall biosynthesis
MSTLNVPCESEIIKRWKNRTPPLVSVTIITYNHEKYIESAIQGALAQKTNFPIEIIIYDDASTDNSQEIIKEYSLKYPNIIVPLLQESNLWLKKGINGTTTIVWPQAKGKYIALCEGDDYWTDPLKLQKQVEFLEANPEYVLCFHDSMVVSHEDKILLKSRNDEKYRRNFTSEELFQIPPIDTLTNCFRNIISDFPKEFAYCPGGDRLLIAVLAQYGHAAYLNTIKPSVYRVHPGGISGGADYTKRFLDYIKTRIYITIYYERIGKYKQAEYILNNQIIGPLSEHISSQDGNIQALNDKISQLNLELDLLRTDRDSQLAERDSLLADRNTQLSEIYSSKIWKLGIWLRRARLLSVPPGSLRARLGRKVLSVVNKLIKNL